VTSRAAVPVALLLSALLGWNISLELRLREVEAVINVPLRALTSVPAVLRKLVRP
jgi:hypothetical protein